MGKMWITRVAHWLYSIGSSSLVLETPQNGPLNLTLSTRRCKPFQKKERFYCLVRCVFCKLGDMADDDKNILEQARAAMGVTLKQIAGAIDSNEPSVSRIFRAQQMGRRELYRSIHDFFGGILSYGEIYDPNIHGDLDKRRAGKLRKLAKAHLDDGRITPRPRQRKL